MEPTTTLTGPGLRLQLALVPWDSRALGFPVAQVDALELTTNTLPSSTIEQLDTWLDEHGVGFVSCRLDSLRLRESMLLEDIGFRFVEMVYSPVLSPLAAAAVADDELVVSPALEVDRALLEDVAGAVFSTGRHVLDPRLDASAGRERYRNWMAAAFDDDGRDVWKASIGETVVGFFVTEPRPEYGVYWHLTAIVPAWQGQGLGKRLWRTMIALHQAAGAVRITTTISAHNVAAVGLYAGLGFRFTEPRSTFHWWRR